ncbi:MAG: hypothetical protein KBA06_03815 [Saprospiraceae bacterium]|nr:hypothetical protein [Saprospiraceae bacterium]
MQDNEWGFFGHRRINRLAVFTLPPEMIGFYKSNIEFITEHAVDPDKRRYASKFEGSRHYLDLDRYGKTPYADLPRKWNEALLKYTDLYIITSASDTLLVFNKDNVKENFQSYICQGKGVKKLFGQDSIFIDKKAYQTFFNENFVKKYYDEDFEIPIEAFNEVLKKSNIGELVADRVFVHDNLTEHGVLPYNLLEQQRRLTNAFKEKNAYKILRISAEIGHYIGDAHVPLHTSQNYNGQLTKQDGIHGFWESRIPELFADDNYDFFVGKCNYIEDYDNYFWNVVLTSNTYVPEVLRIEKELSMTFPQDQQYCYDERLGQTVRTQCKDYAAAYSERLQGSVEKRMRDAILSVGSVWYSCWVDAGQPDLNDLKIEVNKVDEEKEVEKNLDAAFKAGIIKGRAHDN